MQLRSRYVGRRSSTSWDLPDDAILRVFDMLPLAALGRASCVSSTWRNLAACEALWKEHCARVWHAKVAVPSRCRELLAAGSAREALIISLRESASRVISSEELCAQEWSFRFKSEAGPWAASDPWWNDEAARPVRFEPDGALIWPHASEWSGFSWRLCREGGRGCVLRISHSYLGDFPGATLRRHPTNWGYIFNAPWVVYGSFPLVRATDDKCLQDRGLRRSVAAWQWEEATAYNLMAGDDEITDSDLESDGDDEEEDAQQLD